MELLFENRYAITAVLLFGIGFCTVLLKQNLLKKILGFNLMIAAACWLLAVLAPDGERLDIEGLVLVGLVTAAAVTAFAVALIWRVYRRYGTIRRKELLKRAGRDEA